MSQMEWHFNSLQANVWAKWNWSYIDCTLSRTDVDLQFSGLFSTDSGAHLQAGDDSWRTKTTRMGHGMHGNLDCLIRKSHGKPWKGTECHGRLWNMPRETMAINGEPWNPMEGDGRLWNPMEPYGRIMITQS